MVGSAEALVSILGPMRMGKSWLASLLVEQERAFLSRNRGACTKGANVLASSNLGTPVALVDLEGQGDSGDDYDQRLLRPVALTSQVSQMWSSRDHFPRGILFTGCSRRRENRCSSTTPRTPRRPGCSRSLHSSSARRVSSRTKVQQDRPSTCSSGTCTSCCAGTQRHQLLFSSLITRPSSQHWCLGPPRSLHQSCVLSIQIVLRRYTLQLSVSALREWYLGEEDERDKGPEAASRNAIRQQALAAFRSISIHALPEPAEGRVLSEHDSLPFSAITCRAFREGVTALRSSLAAQVAEPAVTLGREVRPEEVQALFERILASDGEDALEVRHEELSSTGCARRPVPACVRPLLSSEGACLWRGAGGDRCRR
jgi:hypothetical protein